MVPAIVNTRGNCCRKSMPGRRQIPVIRKTNNPLQPSKQVKCRRCWCSFVPGRILGYEQSGGLLTKKKSKQKKKGVNIQDNSPSYLRSINTSFIIIIIVCNQKTNTKDFTGISFFSSSGIIYYSGSSGGRYRLVPFGGTIKKRY